MMGPKTVLTRLALVLLFAAVCQGLAQSDGWRVTLVLRDGTQVPFTITPSTGSSSRGLPSIRYHDGSNTGTTWGQFVADVGGTGTRIPIIEQIARLDLVAPGEQTVWRATLKDGRVFDGAVLDASADLFVTGINQFGATESFWSAPRHPEYQPIIGVILDPNVVASASSHQASPRRDTDTVTLRNGDILSGDVRTTEFTIQASYGTLTFTSEQLQSITVENAAGKTDQVLLKVGDRVSGVLQNATIEMTLSSGAAILLEKGNIASITFATER